MEESNWYKPSRATFKNKTQSASWWGGGGGGGKGYSFEINVSGQSYFGLTNTAP